MADKEHLQLLQQGVATWNKWREDNPGIQPDLSGANLSGWDLSGAYLYRARLTGSRLLGANLTRAYLAEADLTGADLTGTVLRGAVLWDADLARAILATAVFGAAAAPETLPSSAESNPSKQTASPAEVGEKTRVHGARLWNADLQDTALTEVEGLFAGQLGATNLHATKLPDDIKDLKGVDQVDELSKNAGKLFLAMLTACAYCWLTLYSTKDGPLLTNSLGTKLPIIETEVPIVWFYLVAPLVVLGLYLYHHLYLQRLWEGLAELPAVFPDGKTVDERTYPWLLNGLVHVYFDHLRQRRPALWRLQQWLSILTAWCIVPFTLFLFWGRHLRRHQWGETHFLIALLAVSVWAGVEFYRLAATTLRNGKTRPPAGNRLWPFVKRQWPAVTAILFGFVFAALSGKAINGVPPRPNANPALRSALLHRWVPRALAAIGCNPFADFREADISNKPATWTGIMDPKKLPEEIALVKGAQLRGAQLQRLDAYGAFLVKADLGGANLTRADLSGAILIRADLRQARLAGADLTGGYISGAYLTGADLAAAYLTGAKLAGAKLQQARLTGADLRQADVRQADLARANLAGANLAAAYLIGSNLTDADLSRANLTGADLRQADLTGANLTGANLYLANLSGAKLIGSHLTAAYLFGAYLFGAALPGANLSGAQLTSAKLRQANLSGANLRQADLREANLRQANLRQADLTGATLTRADLSGADLRLAHLIGARLTGAYLYGTDARKSELAGADLTGVKYDDRTHWPDGFDPQRYRMIQGLGR